MLLGIRWGSLRTKIIIWTFVPTAIILVVVALVTLIAYRDVTEDLVLGRDRELTRLSAGQVAAAMTEYVDTLYIVARTANVHTGTPASQQMALARLHNRLVVFDGGVLLLNNFGRVMAADPERPDLVRQDWSNRPLFTAIRQSHRPVFTDTVADGPAGTNVVAMAVPVMGQQGEFVGVLVGMFRVGATSVSAFYGSIVRQRLDTRGTAYLVDSTGRVIYHSDAGRIGEDFSSQTAVQSLFTGKPGSIRTHDQDGTDIVAGFSPVPGTPWGLVTQVRWATVVKTSELYQRYLFVLLLLGIAVPVVVVSIGVRRITQPIEDLIDAAQQVAGGNFGQTITARTGDEVEELAEQFNLMAAKLQGSYAYLERRVTERTRELEALNTISAAANSSLELDETLRYIVNTTLLVLEVEAGGIYLLNDAGTTLNIATYRGFSSDLVAEIDLLKPGEGFAGRVMESGEPLVVSDVSSDSRLARMALKEAGLHSLASVPLRSKGRMLGVLFAMTYGFREFTEEDVRLLTSIGNQTGVAIENSRLYEQAQLLAALEERSRLARELHDSVTQSLYSLTLLAEGWRRLALDGRIQDVAEPLSELGEIGQQALKEMRLLVYELRPPGLENEGLLGALQQRLSAVEKRAGVEARLLAEDLELPAELEENLYRIAQEALNNTLKHAAATLVTVALEARDDYVALKIDDDGCGFDLNSVSDSGGLGLTTMRERVERLRGTLVLDSSPGRGTHVKVQIPLSGRSGAVGQKNGGMKEWRKNGAGG